MRRQPSTSNVRALIDRWRERRTLSPGPDGVLELPACPAEEEAMKLDRRHFEEHPGETRYVRPFVPGETRGTSEGTHVLVLQVAPGARLRMPFRSEDGVAPSDVVARATWYESRVGRAGPR